MSLELEGEVKDASVNVGNGAIQIGKVSTGKDGVSIVCSSFKEGHSQIQGESIEAGGRVRIETRGGGGGSKGRVVFGHIKCSGRVTIIAGGSESESESDDDDDCVVVVEKKKRAREEEEEDEEEEDEEEEEEEEDEEDEEIEESDSDDEEEADEKRKKTNKKAKGKASAAAKEIINLDN